jgi:transglutaminase-like putative cysteine protease
MTVFVVRHLTKYRYKRPVRLGEHRLMFRPRDSFDQRLLRSDLMISPEPTRLRWNLSTEPGVQVSPRVPAHEYRDMFGNICTRVVAPAGAIEFRANFDIRDSGMPDEVLLNARQHPIDELPDDVLLYLLGSRYCDTQCDFVHNHIKFGYYFARDDRTAFDAYREQVGVCRDFTHLAVALCRCMNIPARYCTGYLGDIGVPPDPAPMDFSAWFEVYLQGRWFTFDARHNRPRIGRVVIARGRDAADVAISTSFGATRLTRFKVVTEEVTSDGIFSAEGTPQLNAA